VGLLGFKIDFPPGRIRGATFRIEDAKVATMTENVANLISDDPALLGFDPVALAQRYQHERDRRLRPERSAQYARVEEKLGSRDRDPYTPWVDRSSIDEDVEVLVVGGGWGGLLAGAYVRKAGVSNIRFVDIAGDFGGTWYWNRYPNLQCDTESYIYMPLLEDLGYVPTRNYVYGPELLAHAQAIGRKFGFYEHTLFHTELTSATWDSRSARWRITTDRGDRLRARHVILAHGAFTQPKLPNIPGIDRYRGHVFHTARWDYGYTDGDQCGGLTGLSDKRVAIIGTGATAIQCVVPVAKSARELLVFQRTPSAIGVRNNRLTDYEWAAGLKPGWQRRRSDAFAAGLEGEVVDEVFPGDGWIPLMSAHRQVLRKLRKAGFELTHA
jgi:cation diffusion facilitator CzcD-associated flavoprotein CzcO